MTRIPELGTDIQLRDQQGSGHRSSVLAVDLDSGTLELAAPPDLAADQPFPPGTRLLASWPEDGAYWVLPVLLVEVRGTGADSRLVAEATDDSWREERRQYARTSLNATVEVDFELADEDGRPGPAAVPIDLIDLSEVALRGIAAADYRDWFQPRIPVTVRLTVPDDRFDIPAAVLLAKPAARLDLGLEVVVLFDRPVTRVEDLRRHLAAGQPTEASA